MVFQKLEGIVRKVTLPVVGLACIGLATTMLPIKTEAKTNLGQKQVVSVQYDEQSLANKLVKEGMLPKGEIENFIGYAKTVKNKRLIEDIGNTYNFSIDIALDTMAQESGFKIVPNRSPKHKEKGTSQTQKGRADELVEKMQNKNDPLYFQHFDFSDYDFNKLDQDYDLNLLMVAANIKDKMNYIQKKGISMDTVFKKLKERGVEKETYQGLKRIKKITNKRVKQCVDTWKNNSEKYKETVVLYLAYNGGGAIRKAHDKKPAAEFVRNTAYLMKNAEYFRKYRNLLESEFIPKNLNNTFLSH